MTSQKPDYYAVLGVGPRASAADVDRAYRRAARATHPDVHPDDASAAERFRAVNVAYETLSDPQRRASYDNAHPSVNHGAAVRIVVHRRPSAAPVHLGRQQPGTTSLRPLRTSPTTPFGDDVIELGEARTRGLWLAVLVGAMAEERIGDRLPDVRWLSLELRAPAGHA